VLNNRQLSFVGQGGSWPGHKKLENVALMRRLFEHNFQTDRRRQLFGQPVSEVLGLDRIASDLESVPERRKDGGTPWVLYPQTFWLALFFSRRFFTFDL